MKSKKRFFGLKTTVILLLLIFSLLLIMSSMFVSAVSVDNTVLRLYSIDFKLDDYAETYGIVGQGYPVELWQEGNDTERIVVTLEYHYDNNRMYLSVAKDSVVTFVYDYNPLRQWKFKFKGREYEAEKVNIMLLKLPDSVEKDPAKIPEQVVNLPPVTVCDWDGNPLYYTDDGFLFNDKAQVYYDDINNTSNLLRVVKETKNNSDVLSSEGNGRFVSLSASSKTVRPLTDVEIDGVTYQIINGNGEPLSIDPETKKLVKPDYNVSSITVNDKLYALKPKAGGSPILAKLVVEKDGENQVVNFLQGSWEVFKRILNPFAYKEMVAAVAERFYIQKFYDLWGHEINKDLYVDLGIQRWSIKPVMTVGDYLEAMLERGQPFLVDGGAKTVGGEQLYDNLGSPLSILYGQLVDAAGYPVICYVDDLNDNTDKLVPRPVFYADGVYYDYNGEQLEVLEYGGLLRLCKNGVPVKSVISDLQRGEEMYFVYMSDGVTMIPSFVDIDSEGDIYYKDLEGNDISKIIVKPNIDITDYYRNNPTEKSMSGWDKFWHYFVIASAIVLAVGGFILIIALIVRIVKFIKSN